MIKDTVQYVHPTYQSYTNHFQDPSNPTTISIVTPWEPKAKIIAALLSSEEQIDNDVTQRQDTTEVGELSQLKQKYFEVKGRKPAGRYANDKAWLRKRIAEAEQQTV